MADLQAVFEGALARPFVDPRRQAVAGGSYSLEDARQAHEDIRSRKTTGKLVIRP